MMWRSQDCHVAGGSVRGLAPSGNRLAISAISVPLPHGRLFPRGTTLEKPDICPRDSWHVNVQDALFLTAKKWKPPKCPPTGEWTKKKGSACTLSARQQEGGGSAGAVKEARPKEVHSAGSLPHEGGGGRAQEGTFWEDGDVFCLTWGGGHTELERMLLPTERGWAWWEDKEALSHL